jgi:hypothetical protein
MSFACAPNTVALSALELIQGGVLCARMTITTIPISVT